VRNLSVVLLEYQCIYGFLQSIQTNAGTVITVNFLRENPSLEIA